MEIVNNLEILQT